MKATYKSLQLQKILKRNIKHENKIIQVDQYHFQKK